MSTSQTMQKGGAKAGSQAQAQQRPYPFPVGVYDSGVQDYDQSIAQQTTPVQLPIWNISPTGWLRGIWFSFTMTTAANAATVVFQSDPTAGGFCGIQKVTLFDLGNETVVQLLGYEWLIMNKFGGYFEVGDPRADLTFSQTAGAGGTGGSFHVMLYLPLEAVGRDGLGVVQNESKPGWKIEVWMDSSGQTYSTPPTSLGTLRLRGFLDSYTEPAQFAPNGRPFAQTPPLPGSLQYWRSESQAQPSGAWKYDLTNGVGFPIRNLIYYARDTGNSTRATADGNWPDPATLLFGNINYFTRSKNLWISKQSKSFALSALGASVPAVDTAQGRENAVFPVWFTQDMSGHPGDELRFKYLDTQVNSLVRIQGSFGAASTIYVLSNWLATPSKNRYALISGGNN